MMWLMLITQLVIMPDTPKDSICMERGHINFYMASTTLVYSVPKVIDLPNKTIIITQNSNHIKYICQRCGKLIQEMIEGKPDTVIIWQRRK